MKGIIISATSDIATQMCHHWKQKGWDLYGTYFSKGETYHSLKKDEIPLVFCDLSDVHSIDAAAQNLIHLAGSWDFLLFATGSQTPVGPFERIDIDEWSASLQLNFVHQMRLLHRLLPYRVHSEMEKSVLFFAGGGTNNSVNNYSAYTLAKIALIKSCELLDSEIADVKFSIIGPGWVKTKIHQATLMSGSEWAGANFEKTRQKLDSDECISIAEVIRSFEWALNEPKTVVGGRNFSTVFDQWDSEELSKLLTLDTDMYKLRRHKNHILPK